MRRHKKYLLILLLLILAEPVVAQSGMTVTPAGVLETTSIHANGNITASQNINAQGQIQERGFALLPRYTVIMWAGTVAQIPPGWAICDGGTYPSPDGTLIKTPDLKGRFPVGYSPLDPDYDTKDPLNLPDVGGEKTHTLTINELPSHAHGLTVVTGNDNNDHSGNYEYFPAAQDVGSSGHAASSPATHGTGGGQAHENRPPYYALVFLMKL